MRNETKIYIGVIALLAIVIGLLGFSIKKQVEVITQTQPTQTETFGSPGDIRMTPKMVSKGVTVATGTPGSIQNSGTRDRIVTKLFMFLRDHNSTLAASTSMPVLNFAIAPDRTAWTFSVATSTNGYSTSSGASYFVTDAIIGTSTPFYYYASTTGNGGMGTTSGYRTRNSFIWIAGDFLTWIWNIGNGATSTLSGYVGVEYIEI